MKVKGFKMMTYCSWILSNCNKVYANDSTDKFAHIIQNKKMAEKGKTSTWVLRVNGGFRLAGVDINPRIQYH